MRVAWCRLGRRTAGHGGDRRSPPGALPLILALSPSGSAPGPATKSPPGSPGSGPWTVAKTSGFVPGEWDGVVGRWEPGGSGSADGRLAAVSGRSHLCGGWGSRGWEGLLAAGTSGVRDEAGSGSRSSAESGRLGHGEGARGSGQVGSGGRFSAGGAGGSEPGWRGSGPPMSRRCPSGRSTSRRAPSGHHGQTESDPPTYALAGDCFQVGSAVFCGAVVPEGGVEGAFG